MATTSLVSEHSEHLNTLPLQTMLSGTGLSHAHLLEQSPVKVALSPAEKAVPLTPLNIIVNTCINAGEPGRLSLAQGVPSIFTEAWPKGQDAKRMHAVRQSLVYDQP